MGECFNGMQQEAAWAAFCLLLLSVRWQEKLTGERCDNICRLGLTWLRGSPCAARVIVGGQERGEQYIGCYVGHGHALEGTLLGLLWTCNSSCSSFSYTNRIGVGRVAKVPTSSE